MKLDIIFHYEVNEQTGEITYIGKDEVTVDTAIKKTSTKKSTSAVDNNPEPIITLENNKLVLSQGAADLLQVYPDCRIDVKYDKKDKKSIPVIATGKAFGNEEKGNKLSKSNTVSYRGAANDKLATFGTVFRLEPTKNEGIFYLVGDKEPAETKVPEEIINIEEIDILDELNNSIDEDEMVNFDFKL